MVAVAVACFQAIRTGADECQHHRLMNQDRLLCTFPVKNKAQAAATILRGPNRLTVEQLSCAVPCDHAVKRPHITKV